MATSCEKMITEYMEIVNRWLVPILYNVVNVFLFGDNTREAFEFEQPTT